MNYSVILNNLKQSVITELKYKDELKKNEIIKKLELYINKIFGKNSEYLVILSEIQFGCWNTCNEDLQRYSWQKATNKLCNLITIILEDLSLTTDDIKCYKKKLANDKVFIIHGHDGELKQEVARFIEKLGLKAVILHEQIKTGETIMERIEGYSNIGFAIALLSPDDKVLSSNLSGKSSETYRARQNVIFEMGFFIGRIGRNRVFTIVKGENLEILSDFGGVVYYSYDNDCWKLSLIKALNNVEYKVDANSLL
ncbi:nucleotide-binding protein [Clostridium sp. 'deep sea']|uniref:TIR domain-containing protein n=1 Tax=Clostridium sp. 'deep sea' TaxID=2779445 RepID=UPI0018967BB6|nr:nucleotide-binding protein [Clostridium sp. 'deep sea']QOR36154.1 nucleotide-binding protein [Clostridium sp. 'deep sea']